ncbi:uncharacterized mitochondrial protein-like protein, partial [Tanacetum coccineum]
MVPRALLIKSGLVSINTARQNISKTAVSVNTAHTKTIVNRVNTVKDKNVNTARPKTVVNTARPKAVVNAVKGNNVNAVKASACWGNPQIDLQDQRVIDSGCSRHMIRNMSYLTDYEEIDGGYVAFGGNPKGGKIIRKENEDNINNTNNVNVASTNKVNAVNAKTSIELLVDPNMLALEDISIFDFSRSDEDDDAEADMNNLDTTIQMSSMGELTFFLGLQVQQKNDGIFISQDKYVGEILKKFGFTKVKTASTPMETQNPLLKAEDGEEVDVHMYRSMIGLLMYLTSSKPDIMFVVCACARYQVNPKVSHLHAVKIF